jgi:zinc protease
MYRKLLFPALALIVAAPGTAQNASSKATGPGDSESGLVAELAAPGRVANERRLPADVTEWRLSNGARVLVKPTTFKADEVVFTAYSPGGSSLVADEDFMSASMSARILQLSGLGRYTQSELDRKLSGKGVKVVPAIGSTTEELSGSAPPKELETLFQLIHLNFTAPRLDVAAFNAFRTRIARVLSSRGLDPEEVFNDTVTVTMAQNHFRARPLTVPVFNEVEPARALEIHKERFANAGDFTFVFVGNFALPALKALSEKYLANLPANGRRENWKDTEPAPPKGAVEKTVRRGRGANATTQLLFYGPVQYNVQNRVAMRATIELLQMELNERLRAQLGGNSISVQGGPARVPRPEYLIRIQYNSAPGNVDKLAESVLSVIDSLKAHGPAIADVSRVIEQMKRTRAVDIKTNAFWLLNIAAREQADEDIGGLLGPYDELIRQLSTTKIQQAARQYFDTKSFAKFVLLPEAPRAR